MILAAAAIYVLLICWSRLIGPRSFSQMTAFDIGVTVALGAIVGGTATGATPLWGGVLGLSSLFAIRGVVARLRRRGLDRIVDNRPILVMARDRVLEDRLLDARITRGDLLEALRAAGITRFSQVLATRRCSAGAGRRGAQPVSGAPMRRGARQALALVIAAATCDTAGRADHLGHADPRARHASTPRPRSSVDRARLS